MLTNIKYGKSKYIRKYNNKHKKNKKSKTKLQYKKNRNFSDKYRNKKTKQNCNHIDFRSECLHHKRNDNIVDEYNGLKQLKSILYPFFVDLNIKINVCHLCQLINGGTFYSSFESPYARLKRYKLTAQRCVDCYDDDYCQCRELLIGCKDSLNSYRYRCKSCYLKWYPNMISNIIEEVSSVSLGEDVIDILCDYVYCERRIKCCLYYTIERLHDNKLICKQSSGCNPLSVKDCKSICIKGYRLDNSILVQSIQDDSDWAWHDYTYPPQCPMAPDHHSDCKCISCIQHNSNGCSYCMSNCKYYNPQRCPMEPDHHSDCECLSCTQHGSNGCSYCMSNCEYS